MTKTELIIKDWIAFVKQMNNDWKESLSEGFTPEEIHESIAQHIKIKERNLN